MIPAHLALLVLLGAWLLPWVLLDTVLQALQMPQVHMALMMGWFGWLALARVATHDLILSSLHSLCHVVKL